MLQCLHQYSLMTDVSVQSKILETLTVLIELGVNYSQLDEESVGLRVVLIIPNKDLSVDFPSIPSLAFPQDRHGAL